MNAPRLRPFLTLFCACGLLTPQAWPAVPPTGSTSADATESLDLEMYSRIRDEGFRHSRVMEYAGALLDDIGPRLTGSPAMARANEWTRQQLEAMGCSNAHLESWGEFGMAWTQRGAYLQLVKPSPGVMNAQATPWSPATTGPVEDAEVMMVHALEKEADFAALKGKLRGKVLLYGRSGESPKVNPDRVPTMDHQSADKLREIASYPLDLDMSDQFVPSAKDMKQYVIGFQKISFQEKVGKFFHDEGAVAILVPGGSGGVLHDDTNYSLGWFVYQAQHRQMIPEEVIATENWDRIERLLDNKVPVHVSLNIDTQFGDEHSKGYNTIAEIPGTDPQLKDQVVMVGGHLDSWIAGTGATDNGAGALVAMEAMRILNALHVKPRRTLRIALWSGEEEGEFGSANYVAQHFGTVHLAEGKEVAELPDFLRSQVAPPTLKPDAALLDAYYNLDNGTGKIQGVFTEENEGVGEIFAQWMKPLEDLGMTTITQRNTGSTDHESFQQVGLPGFQFIQDPRDYDSRTHHTNLDTYEHLSEPDLKQAAVVEAIFLYNTAMRNAMLPRPQLPFNGEDKPLPGLYPDAK